MVTVAQYCKITRCSPWFNLYQFTYEEVCEFLEKLGYEIVIHTGIIKTQMIQSIPGTGEVERVGDPVNLEQEFVVAVKKGRILPYNLNDLGYAFSMNDVFQMELKKKLLA
jgi:hypothetical protein